MNIFEFQAKLLFHFYTGNPPCQDVSCGMKSGRFDKSEFIFILKLRVFRKNTP